MDIYILFFPLVVCASVRQAESFLKKNRFPPFYVKQIIPVAISTKIMTYFVNPPGHNPILFRQLFKEMN
jgi:hypothetical protein